MAAPVHPISDAQSMMAYQTYKKETLTAFLLWWFLGIFGGHRFYMGQTGSGVAMLVITLISIPLSFILIGFVSLFAVWLWWLIDAFLICGWVNNHNIRLMKSIDQQVQASPFQLPDSSPSQLPGAKH